MNMGWVIGGIVLAAVALIVTGVILWLQNKAQRKMEEPIGTAAPSADGEADQLIRAASARLAQSKAGAGVANLPMIFIVGDKGTAKTSSILNSGLDAELLAGQVYQDNAVAPTRSANIFFARGTVFVEAGGALMANPQAWSSLVKKLAPSRLKSMGASGQAPRGVLLCFDLETFTRSGATEAIVNATRYLQARLGEISEILGISYPVYVLFTRADRLPFFAEFVRNLSMEEAGQVVGATVPIRPAAAGGVYAEEETQRLTWAFNLLFHSFCDHRLMLLPREADAAKLPQAYEFPREFRKLRASLVQFLVDVCRPSQLRAGPFLRGFYFSGVRPVAAAEAPAPLVAPSAPSEGQAEVGGATRMFRAGFQAEQKARQSVAQAGGGASKRVPQWLFLGHLFNDVILADANGRAASGSSTKTSLVKRLLIGSVAAFCLIYSGLLLWSYFGNRALEQDALTAAKAIAAGEGAGGAVPGIDSLQNLETVRQSLANLMRYERDGAPLRLRFGLYKGSDILPGVRKIYYAKFRQLLFGSTQAQMLAFLQRTPAAPAPSDEYAPAYDTLKAYLLTTSEWKRSSDAGLQSFLGSKLDSRWIGGREGEIGKERLDLAKLQFDFYASDLHNENPYPPNADSGAVTRARVYLSQFSGLDRVYQGLLAMADKQLPAVSFNQKFPGTATVVTSAEPVRGAFTKDGAKLVQDAIRKQNFAGEEWVLGPYKGQMPDKAAMEKGLFDKYSADYIAQWRNVLKKSNVNRYGGLKDASNKLNILTGSTAPLLALFWWTSQNTCVDVPGVAEKFKAPQTVVPCPGAQVMYIVDANRPYNSGLQALQQAVDKAAEPTANKDDAANALRDSGKSAELTARQMGSAFPPDTEAQLEQRSLDLLLQPIRYLDGMVASNLKGAGENFCQAFYQATRRKFPFDSQSKQDATLEELGQLLQAKTGKLWIYYESNLKNVLQCANGECSASGSTPLNPGFPQFIGNLMKFSRALYGEAGTDMNYQYTLTPKQSDQVESFEITVNGETTKLKGGAQHSYTWPGSGTRNFKLSLRLSGGTFAEQGSYDGPWSVFHFFNYADRNTGNVFSWAPTTGRDQQPQKVNGRALVYDLSVSANGPVIFSKEFLSKLNCVVPVAR